jgi:hypothetical protein
MVDRSNYSDKERLAIIETEVADIKSWMRGWDGRLWIIVLSSMGALITPLVLKITGGH